MGDIDKGPRCGFCGKLGHRAQNCPEVAKHNRQAEAARKAQAGGNDSQGGC
jgi:hypothetical protein